MDRGAIHRPMAILSGFQPTRLESGLCAREEQSLSYDFELRP